MVWLIVAGVVLFVVGAFVVHAGDYPRLALAVGGIGLVLFGMLRWSTQRERAPEESDARHGYGDSIVDVRTSVDPAVGMRPVGSEPHHR